MSNIQSFTPNKNYISFSRCYDSSSSQSLPDLRRRASCYAVGVLLLNNSIYTLKLANAKNNCKKC